MLAVSTGVKVVVALCEEMGMRPATGTPPSVEEPSDVRLWCRPGPCCGRTDDSMGTGGRAMVRTLAVEGPRPAFGSWPREIRAVESSDQGRCHLTEN